MGQILKTGCTAVLEWTAYESTVIFHKIMKEFDKLQQKSPAQQNVKYLY